MEQCTGNWHLCITTGRNEVQKNLYIKKKRSQFICAEDHPGTPHPPRKQVCQLKK